MDGCAAIEFLDYLFFLRNKMNMCFYHQDGLQEINSEILHSGLKCHNKQIIGHAYVWLYNVLNVFFSNRVAIFLKFFNVDFCALGASIKLHFFSDYSFTVRYYTMSSTLNEDTTFQRRDNFNRPLTKFIFPLSISMQVCTFYEKEFFT